MIESEKTIISIIIPVYNAAPYIEETLNSVFNQTFTDFELIIIDDGSTDNGYQIISDYSLAHKDTIRLFKQKNMGQAGTRNNALQYVNGEYISFLDADDIILPDYLEKLINATKNDNPDLVVSGFRLFDERTQEILEVRNPQQWTETFNGDKTHTFVYSPCGKLIKTKFIKKHNITFVAGELLEDGPYSMLVDILANKVAVLDYEGYMYRQRSDSTIGDTKKVNHNPKVPYRGIEEAILKVRRNNATLDQEIILEYCAVKILAGLVTRMYTTISKEKRKELCEYCYRIMDTYFPNTKKNPYFKIRKLKKLPLVHRIAVKMYLIAYRMKILYPFSLLASKVL